MEQSTVVTKSYSKKQYLEWYELMLRIRRFEEKTLVMYGQQKIRGFCHVYIGQEAVAAGLASAKRPGDNVITAYRQHGTALACGLNSRECMAELYGKYTGCVKGKGGSMHFFSKEKRFFGGHGIVGGQIPIGAGIAFAEKYNGTDNATVCYFGDGAARQGALHETFNMAMTWKLPVIFICENNGYAMGTSVERTTNVHDIWKLGLGYDMPSEAVNGMTPEAVHEAMSKAFKHVRAGKGPYFLEIKTYRYKGHSVSDPAKYRSKEELAHYKGLDPVKVIERKLVETKKVTEAAIKKIKADIKAEIVDAVDFAETSPYPPISEVYEDVYIQKDFPHTT